MTTNDTTKNLCECIEYIVFPEKNSDLIDLAEVDEENPYLNKDISRSIIIEDGTVDVDDI